MRSHVATARTLMGILALALVLMGPSARAQMPSTEERLKILTDPESVKAKLEKDKSRPPLEFFRSQVAPFDILPYLKANHWSTLSLELRANYEDYAGLLQTAPVALQGMPQEVVYRREARLVKEQRMHPGLQIMLPSVPKEMNVELIRPEAIRPDEVWQASLRVLEPHQMLVLVLTKASNDAYARWSRMNALTPSKVDRGDPLQVDRQRYYRLVLPLEPDQPPLSAHPLTWTTISHAVWDGMEPDTLNPPQQQAMLDWLHWGGQLILVGGARPSFQAMRDSFLGPYLPADPTGESALLGEAELSPLSESYRPPVIDDRDEPKTTYPPPPQETDQTRHYRGPDPIRPARNRPVFVAGLKPREGSSQIPMGEASAHLLGVERRVGRGRVLMLTIDLNDPALAAWAGLDTMIRRVVLRRPEEFRVPLATGSVSDPIGGEEPRDSPLPGPDLSWFRYLGRDLGASIRRVETEAERVELNRARERWRTTGRGGYGYRRRYRPPDSPEEPFPRLYSSPRPVVAEWADSVTLPRMSRDALEAASGITVPSSTFVLKVILAYLIALVPLNWLICRYALGRREWAWAVVPALSLGFAIGVERLAAYDVGYDVACDEIDVVEAYGDYPRAHVSRFASLFTTGRGRFTISYPKEPTALALPMDRGRSLAGEDVTTSAWQSSPVPALDGFQVEPRSLAMFRAEQMSNLAGPIALVSDGTSQRVVNQSELELRDAVLVDVAGYEDRRETFLGTIAPFGSAEVRPGRGVPSGQATSIGEIDPRLFLREFRMFGGDRPEEKGEIRLVAWSPQPVGGQVIEPPVDRHRGFTAVVVHLRNGPPPAPDGPTYNLLVREPVPPPAEAQPGSPGLPGGSTGARIAPSSPGAETFPVPAAAPPAAIPDPQPGRASALQ